MYMYVCMYTLGQLKQRCLPTSAVSIQLVHNGSSLPDYFEKPTTGDYTVHSRSAMSLSALLENFIYQS